MCRSITMSPRPYWKGYLKLSLVSCPIALHAACASSERISFRQINRKTGNRLRQQLIDEETRDPIDAHDKGRGYEIGKGQFLLIEDEELEAIEIESTHTIDIDSFVPRSEIDRRFFDTPYYVTPNDPVGQDAFAVIREAMRSKALVALGRVVLSKRERVMALEPYGKGLIGTTLRYSYEVRHATDYFDEIPDLCCPRNRKLVMRSFHDFWLTASVSRMIRRAFCRRVGSDEPRAANKVLSVSRNRASVVMYCPPSCASPPRQIRKAGRSAGGVGGVLGPVRTRLFS